MRKLLVGIWLFAALSSVMNAQDSGNGLHYSKTSDFDYKTMEGTITLETFVEGEVKSVPAPIDVVLVLDVSDSMKGDKWAALKNSAKRVVSMLNDLVKSGGDARLGIVSFARNAKIEASLTKVDDAGATALNTAVDGLEMGQTTGMNKGLEKAYELLNTTESLAREQYILFFTDGKPGDNTGDISVANSTSKQAYDLKKMGAQFFSILIWTDKTEPSKSYISNLNDGTNNLGTNLSIEHFLQLISSHYPWYYNLSTSGGTYPSVTYYYYQDFATKKNTTKFANIPQSDTDISYYRVTRDASGLESLFADVASTIVAGASIELEETTVLKDILSTYCSLPPGSTAASIKTFTANCTDYDSDTHEYTFGEKSPISGLSISIDDNTQTIEVSGYDYSEHWCGFNSTISKVVGQKLIVEIPYILNASELIENHLYEVELNRTGSGLYTPDGIIESFTPAKFDFKTVTISVSGIQTGDSAIFDVYCKIDETTSLVYSIVLTGKDDSGSTVSATLMFVDSEATYTVKEQTPWNWTYAMASESPSSITKNMAEEATDIVQFNFINVKRTSKLPVHGEAMKNNDFTNDIVQSTVSVSDPESITNKLYF